MANTSLTTCGTGESVSDVDQDWINASNITHGQDDTSYAYATLVPLSED